MLRLPLLALIAFVLPATADPSWTFQQLNNPFVGEHTGVKVYDLNHDGYPDLLFSAGRHSIDQSYALMNLGPVSSNQTVTGAKSFGGFLWSRELPFGSPGGYYQVDVAPLSTLDDGHLGVLLAGGICTRRNFCVPGTKTPAVLLDAHFYGCSATDEYPDPHSCQVEWNLVWTETPATGNRNGALSTFLGKPGKPVIVLVGGGRLTVTHWDDKIKGYPTTPDYELLAEDKIWDEDDDINRSAGLAVGYVGKQKAIVLGPRTTGFRAPAPVVIVYQEKGGNYYSHYHVEEDNNPNTTVPGYEGNPNVDVQPTGIALADLNGDGNTDIIPANFFAWQLLEEGFPIVQQVYLVDKDPEDDTPLVETSAFEAFVPARVVAAANLFDDSELPDLVYGMATGDIVLVANKGVNPATGEFLGFEFRTALTEVYERACIIRDLEVASLDPCTISIIAATICYADTLGNAVFTAEMPHLQSCIDYRKGLLKHAGGGHPHIKRWDQNPFTFPGECDLVLVHSSDFHNGNGIDLHARSTIKRSFAYFESLAVKIASETIEFHHDHYFINGEKHLLTQLPFAFGIGAHKYVVDQVDGKPNHTNYIIQLDDTSQIKIRFFKKFAKVDIDGFATDFADSVGLLGNYSTGAMLGREGQTINNSNDFGLEWQVMPDQDPLLFQRARGPQLPVEHCRVPDVDSSSNRRLRGNTSLLSEAKEACAHVRNKSVDFQLCVDDVLLTGEISLADLW